MMAGITTVGSSLLSTVCCHLLRSSLASEDDVVYWKDDLGVTGLKGGSVMEDGVFGEC